jgi:tetratricopeptide (TPR) repeat protein
MGECVMRELPKELHEQIENLCSDGDELVEKEMYSSALNKYFEALDLLPDPKSEWEATTWILVAIGDVNFITKDYVAGRENFGFAMYCPGAIGNPFIHLRFGQCLFELVELDKAADELTRAYLLEDEKIFENEDTKYIEFVKSKLLPEPERSPKNDK